MMRDFFASGRVADFILMLMAVETVAAIAWRRRTGRGVDPTGLMINMLAGVGLVLALRGAMVNLWWGWIAVCLASACLAHFGDLYWRWRR